MPEHNQLFVLVDANARTGRRGGDGEGLAVRSVKFSVPTAEIRSMKNGGDSFPFLRIMGLYCSIRSSAPPRPQLQLL